MSEKPDVLVGDLLIGALQGRAASRAAWMDSEISAATRHLAKLGLDAAAAARLFKDGSANTLLSWAGAVREAYRLDRRQLDDSLREAGLTRSERRAALGLPPR